MPFCPNPECPNVKRLGKPAEYVSGVSTCSDCGSKLLNDEVIVVRDNKPRIGDFQKRVLYTVGMAAMYRVLTHVPVPGVDTQALGNFLVERGGNSLIDGIFGVPRVSVFALGLMPYISASIIIEVLALVLKPLKSWRESGYKGRVKLRRAALVATIVLALVQGYGIAKGLANMGGGGFLYSGGIEYLLFLSLTLTAGTFIAIWIANQITRNGIGHGICVLILTGFAAGLFARLAQLPVSHEESLIGPLLFTLLAGSVLVAVIVLMERSCMKISVRFDNGREASIPLKMTTAGTVPAIWASTVVMFPVTIAAYINSPTSQWIAHLFLPETIAYYLVHSLALILLYYLFTSAFYSPDKLIALLKRNSSSMVVPTSTNVEDYVDRRLEIMAIFGSLYLCALTLIPDILIKFFNLPIFLGGVALIEAVAITLDIWGEVAFRRREVHQIKVAEVHDVVSAGLVRSVLENHGIPCLLRGYYYRALLYFFGPYVEISIIVPEDRVAEASELINGFVQ